MRRINCHLLAATGVAGLVAMGIAPAATSAATQPNVAMESAVFVEKAPGGTVRSLEPVSRLNRGDRVVTIVTWYRMGGAGGFVITNPLPRSIAYQDSARDNQEVSIDGGRTWGQLGDLRIAGRFATPEDVTHVRWRISPDNAAQGCGQIAYSGIVR